MKATAVFLLALNLSVACPGQDPQMPVDPSRLADELTGFEDEDANYEAVYENLVQVLANPVNINTAGEEDLRMLHVLTERQIRQLISYRETNGLLLSIFELQAVPGLDLETIRRLMPLVKVGQPLRHAGRSLLKRISENPGNYLMMRYERTLERKKGFEDPDALKKFQGSEDKMYMRFRSSRPGDFSVGFTAEKDAGERWGWSPSRNVFGADFLSFHAQLKDKGRLRNLVVGDFQTQFGQGLILGGPFGLGKGSETITTTRRTNIGFLPYTSVNESGFFRGAAATVTLTKRFLVSSYYSRTRRDGTTDIDEPYPVISSFQLTGLYRNDNEIGKRGVVREDNYGGVIGYRHRKVDAGLVFSRIRFDGLVRRKPSVYNGSGFTGDKSFTYGGFLNYNIGNFTFFSEVAHSASGGYAAVAGFLGSLSPRLDVAMLYRRFDTDYHSFYANAFSESTSPQNERGFYWGWKYRWNRRFTLHGYADLFRFPWLSFRRYSPTAGHEWLARLDWHPTRKMELYLLAREESKARNSGEESIQYRVDQGVKRNYCFSISHTLSETWKFRTRAQYSTFSIGGSTSQGLVLLQDLSFSKGRFRVTARYALFETADHDNRHYVYENDVWMAFSLPAYSGKGLRSYVMVQYKASAKVSLWARYAVSRYTDRDEIGSGLDASAGSVRNDIKLQALFRF